MFRTKRGFLEEFPKKSVPAPGIHLIYMIESNI